MQVFYPFRFVLSLTANKIVLGWSVVGRRRFDGLAVVGVSGRNRRNRRRGRRSLLLVANLFLGQRRLLALGHFSGGRKKVNVGLIEIRRVYRSGRKVVDLSKSGP